MGAWTFGSYTMSRNCVGVYVGAVHPRMTMHTNCQLPPFLTWTRANMIWPLASFPAIVPATSALPVITAVLPYTRTFISETSLEVSLVRPVLKLLTICDLSDIWPYKFRCLGTTFFFSSFAREKGFTFP